MFGLILACASLLAPVASTAASPVAELNGLVAPEEAEVLVFSPALFDEPLQRWIDYRIEQGHRICVYRPANYHEMRTLVKQLAQHQKLKTIILVGDAPDRLHPANEPYADFETPTGYVAAEINVSFGSEPWIATDNPLADLDDDHIPELSIGRLAVHSQRELEIVVDKIIRYESQMPHSPWRRRINLVAGVGGFGLVADTVLENSTKRFVVEGIPTAYDASMTYGSWQSAYCPAPPNFRQSTIDRFNDGCLFWVYIGHGSPGRVAPLETPGGRYEVLRASDAPQMVAREGLPIAIFLACYTAALDYNQQGNCLAEAVFTQPQGPIAVLGASRVSMPYSMAVMSHEMMREYFAYEHATLGELCRAAKQQSMLERTAEEDQNRFLLDGLAGTFSPTRDQLPEERRENLSLFNLIGDPLLKLSYPQAITLSEVASPTAGGQLVVKGESPIDGKLIVDVVYRRDRLRVPFAGRSEYAETPELMQEFEATYSQANDRTVVQFEQQVAAGPFEVTLDIPAWAFGASTLRAYVTGESAFATASQQLSIRRDRTQR